MDCPFGDIVTPCSKCGNPREKTWKLIETNDILCLECLKRYSDKGYQEALAILVKRKEQKEK